MRAALLLCVLCGCSVLRAGSAGDMPESLHIPAPRAPRVVEQWGAPQPDFEQVGRDPFLNVGEGLTPQQEDPVIVLPPAPRPPPKPKPPEVQCPRCEVTSIIEGRFSQFTCGDRMYGVGEEMGEDWVVSGIRSDVVHLRQNNGGSRTCALPFARSAATPIEEP